MTSFYSVGRFSDSVIRQCSRCRMELTDAASRECGVGPICRGKDNAIFARQMNANVAVASALFLSIEPGELGRGCEGFEPIRETFIDKVCRLQVSNDDITNLVLHGEDFRKVVDWLDYSLSFHVSWAYRNKVIQIVDSLGYRALAGVLRGDVCMSPAKLYIEGTSIKLEGKACKPGWKAMRLGVPGVKLPRYRGDKTPYQASVKHAEKFIELALSHWPFIDESVDVESLKALAKEIAAQPEVQAADVNRLSATVKRRNPEWFSVSAPWSADMPAILEKFKQLPRNDRTYDPASRSWTFRVQHMDYIMTVLGRCYSVQFVGV